MLYSRTYSLAQDVVAERNKAFTYPGNIAIPSDAKPSGLVEVAKLVGSSVTEDSEANPYSMEEQTKTEIKDKETSNLISEFYEWKFQVVIKIENCPDYSFEEEFRVFSVGSEINKDIKPNEGANPPIQDTHVKEQPYEI